MALRERAWSTGISTPGQARGALDHLGLEQEALEEERNRRVSYLARQLQQLTTEDLERLATAIEILERLATADDQPRLGLPA